MNTAAAAVTKANDAGPHATFARALGRIAASVAQRVADEQAGAEEAA